MPRWYAKFIDREYRRLFMSAYCKKHGRIPENPRLTTVRDGVHEILCPKCRLEAPF